MRGVPGQGRLTRTAEEDRAMDQESKGLLLKQIKEGGYLPDAMVDVHKVLVNAGMELYAKLCCDRIEAAGLVDGVHVSHGSPTSWKLQVDS